MIHWSERVFCSHTDERVAHAGSSNAKRTFSPRGTTDFVVEEFIILWAVWALCGKGLGG